MNGRPFGWIAAILVAGAIGAPAASSAEVPRADEAMPVATKYPPEAILGEWSTQGGENRPPARVRFERAQDGTYMGILSWSAAPRKDIHNKNPNLRDRSVVGIALMWNLRYGGGEYVDGYVYNPEDGGTYRVKTELSGTDS